MTIITSPLRIIQIILIRGYQWIISPILPGTCRHLPTCSDFAIEAIKTYGPFQGLKLATQRIFRCQPWGTSGFDPVPLKVKEKNSSGISKKAVAEVQIHGYTSKKHPIQNINTLNLSVYKSAKYDKKYDQD